MYGAKGTSTILNTVTRQGVIAKQLTGANAAPKASTFLSSISSRNVTAAKLPYTTRASAQYKQTSSDSNENNTSTFQPAKPWITKRAKPQTRFRQNLSTNDKHTSLETTLITREQTPREVIDAFVASKDTKAKIPPQTYEAVLNAYSRIQAPNLPLVPMMNVYSEMIAKNIKPSSRSYTLLINSLCMRDSEVNKLLGILNRQSARNGAPVAGIEELKSEKNVEQALVLFDRAIAENATGSFKVETYNRLLYTLSLHDRTADGMYIYEQLEQNHRIRPDSNTFVALMLLFGGAKKMPAVMECFSEYKLVKDQLPEHDPTQVYNSLCYAYVRGDDIPMALDVLENIMVNDGIGATITPYNKVIRSMCRQGQLESAVDLVKKLSTVPTLPDPDTDTYSNLLSGYCEVNDIEHAGEMYKKVMETDISRQFGHLADYVYLCVKKEQPEQAYNVVKEICGRGILLDANMTRVVVNGFIAKGDQTRTVEVLNELFEIYSNSHYVKPNSPFFGILWNTFQACPDIVTANSVMNMAEKFHAGLVAPEARHYIALYLKAKDNNETWEAFSKIADSTVYSRLFNAAFSTEETIDVFSEQVLTFLEDMNKFGIKPEVSLDLRVAMRFKKNNDKENLARWQEAMVPYKESFEEEIASKSKTEVVEGSAQTPDSRVTLTADILSGKALEAAIENRPAEALRILEEDIIKTGQIPTPEAVRDMIQYATKKDNIELAKKIYEITQAPFQRLSKNSYFRLTQTINNAMMIAYARSKNFPMAKKFYNDIRMHHGFPNADAYGAYLVCICENSLDEFAEAMSIYEEAKKNGVRLTVFFYNVMISKLAKCRKGDAALGLFDEMKSFGITPNSITYASIVSACIRCSFEASAVKYFNEMLRAPRYLPRIGVFNSMIQFYVQQNPNREKALEYFRLLNQNMLKPTAHTYRLLIEAYANIPAYDMITAHGFIADMKKHGIQPNASHYGTLIQSYGCLHRDVPSAMAVYNEMKKAGVPTDTTVHQVLLSTFIENNELTRAEEYYQNMLANGESSSPYIENLFITCYGQQNQLEKAEAVFNKMVNELGSSKSVVREPSTFIAMVTAYKENNNRDKALDVIEQMRARRLPAKLIKRVEQMV
ncbi:hypothetical protein CLU79DRAFT_733002 [Phycomyces nitens]|nr:hypothetical protein CLU79DRAFT_733002 [Phycomyces nitens]